MIYLYSQGRLGNQFFQYAAARSMQKTYDDEEIFIYFTKDENQLKNFHTKFRLTSKLKLNIIQKFILFNFWVLRRLYSNNIQKKQQKIEKYFQPFLNFFGIYWNTQGYFKMNKSNFKNKIMIGFYGSEKYFTDVSDIIKKELVPINPKRDNNKELYRIIKNKQSVFVGVRRGDFVKINNIVCNQQYYDKAFSIIQDKVDNPVYIVFSDDIEWVKNNMTIPGEVYYECGKDPVWETIRLMYSCKYFIINNSTMHWWAQYLSLHENKIVIAPKRWKNYDVHTDMPQESWIKIDN